VTSLPTAPGSRRRFDFYGESWTDIEPEEFNGLRAQLEAEYRPRNAVESMYVAELAHCTCEIREMRRLQGLILHNHSWESLASVLADLKDVTLDDLLRIFECLSTGAPDAEVEQLLKKHDKILGMIISGQVRLALPYLRLIAEMLRSSERRRDRVIEKLDDLCATRQHRPQRGSSVIDVEACDVTPRHEKPRTTAQRTKTRRKSSERGKEYRSTISRGKTPNAE